MESVNATAELRFILAVFGGVDQANEALNSGEKYDASADT